MREREVCGGDGHAVAPARFRPDAVGQPKRVPLDVHPRDEVRSYDEVGTCLERSLENLRHRGVKTAAARERIQARRLGLGRAEGDDGAAALRSLRARATGARDGNQERDGERRR